MERQSSTKTKESLAYIFLYLNSHLQYTLKIREPLFKHMKVEVSKVVDFITFSPFDRDAPVKEVLSKIVLFMSRNLKLRASQSLSPNLLQQIPALFPSLNPNRKIKLLRKRKLMNHKMLVEAVVSLKRENTLLWSFLSRKLIP